MFSTFFAEIFPYPTNIVQIINNRMMQSLHSLCDHPSDRLESNQPPIFRTGDCKAMIERPIVMLSIVA